MTFPYVIYQQFHRKRIINNNKIRSKRSITNLPLSSRSISHLVYARTFRVAPRNSHANLSVDNKETRDRYVRILPESWKIWPLREISRTTKTSKILIYHRDCCTVANNWTESRRCIFWIVKNIGENASGELFTRWRVKTVIEKLASVGWPRCITGSRGIMHGGMKRNDYVAESYGRRERGSKRVSRTCASFIDNETIRSRSFRRSQPAESGSDCLRLFYSGRHVSSPPHRRTHPTLRVGVGAFVDGRWRKTRSIFLFFFFPPPFFFSTPFSSFSLGTVAVIFSDWYAFSTDCQSVN